MKFLSDICLNLYKKAVSNKVYVVKLLIVIAFVALGSFLIEYYGFGHKLQTLGKTEAGIQVIKKADIAAENFGINEQGIFVSSAENASLIVTTQGRFVQNLELALGENPNYDITVKYVDPKTNQEVALQKTFQKSMQKNSFDFLHFLVFRIENNPQEITIQAASPQYSISDIRIDNSYHFNFYRFFFVFLIGVLVLIFVVFRKMVGKKPEYVFFAIALICGTLLSVSEPRAYVSWDEAIHYKQVDGNSFGNIINNGVKDIYSSTNSVPSSYSIKEQGSMDEYFDGLKSKESKGHKSKGFFLFNFSLRDFYNQVAYIPSGLALMLGRLIHLPNHLIFIFGRWMNVLVYASVIFFAIRKLKTGKMIMAVVALLPTAIFLASNYGYDAWVTAFMMLGLAYLLSELQQPEKKITTREMSIMLGAFVIGLGPKAIYFPLMFLLFLLKKEKFESLKQYKKFMWASAISLLNVVGSFMLPFVIGGPGKGDHRGGGDVNSAKQVQFILSDPIAYTKILFNFVGGYINPLNGGGFTTFFAYLGSIKGFYVILATIIVVALTDKNKFDRETSGWKIKALVFAIYLATVVLISTALYVAFTTVKNTTISGVQPRYLIPLIFPLLFVIGSSRIKNPINRNIYNFVIFVIMAFVTLQGIWDLIIRNYY